MTAKSSGSSVASSDREDFKIKSAARLAWPLALKMNRLSAFMAVNQWAR